MKGTPTMSVKDVKRGSANCDVLQESSETGSGHVSRTTPLKTKMKQQLSAEDAGIIESTGYPQAPTKYSFRKLLDSLSADEFQRRVNEDPQFVAAIDKLNNGNR